MKRLVRFTLSFGLVCALAAYFFSGRGRMRLVDHGEAMSFQDFANNPAIVARHNARLELFESGETTPSAAKVGRAYDAYRAQIEGAEASLHPALRGTQDATSALGERVEAFRVKWFRVYQALTPRAGKRPIAGGVWVNAAWSAVRERMGMAVTLALLIGALIGLMRVARWMEGKLRA